MRMVFGVLASTLLVVGCAGASGGGTSAASAPAPSTVASPSQAAASASAAAETPAATATPKGGFGGKVQFKLDGGPATTTIDALAEGAKVSGTAVTAYFEGTHTVRLGCANQNGDIWTLGGTTEKTTIHNETPGTWSALMVKAGSPQQIAIWFSQDASAAKDCDAWLASFNPLEFGTETWTPVESGSLVFPADLAP